jgi:hypothetical protein
MNKNILILIFSIIVLLGFLFITPIEQFDATTTSNDATMDDTTALPILIGTTGTTDDYNYIFISNNTVRITNIIYNPNKYQNEVYQIEFPDYIIKGTERYIITELDSNVLANLINTINKINIRKLPSQLLSINDGAFNVYNETLNIYPNNIVLPDTLKYIGSYAFNFIQMNSIIIPSSVTEINNSAFSNTNLKSIYFKNKSLLTRSTIIEIESKIKKNIDFMLFRVSNLKNNSKPLN